MTAEHREIQRSVDEMRDAISRGNELAFLASHQRLLGVLAPHHLKEKRVLYPMIDEVLTPSERAALVHRLAGPA
jgi:hypothetical protein